MHCPICKREIEYSPNNPFRPFCSERCRMIDLGMWASERYGVAGGPTEDHEHRDDQPRKPRGES